jgi:hypothetical protein
MITYYVVAALLVVVVIAFAFANMIPVPTP